LARRRSVSRMRAFHRAGDPVGIHDHPALGVPRGAADGLDQRGLRAQEALLVGIEDRHQPAFGDVEPLAQQVDAHQHVEGAEPQVAQDLDPLERVDVRMHVAHADALFVQVFGQILGHALGQRRAPARGSPSRVSCGPRRAGRRPASRRAGSPPAGRSGRWADHLFGEDAAGLLHLPRAGVAETKTDCGRIASHSSNFSGRLSMQDGRRKPCSASVNLRR
jgi:hypothetical protein